MTHWLGWLLFIAGISLGLFLLYFILDIYFAIAWLDGSTEPLMVSALTGITSFPVWCMASLGAKLLEGTLGRWVVFGIYGMTCLALIHALYCLTL